MFGTRHRFSIDCSVTNQKVCRKFRLRRGSDLSRTCLNLSCRKYPVFQANNAQRIREVGHGELMHRGIKCEYVPSVKPQTRVGEELTR